MIDDLIIGFLLMVYGVCWFLGGYYIGEGSWLKKRGEENEKEKNK